MKGIRSNWEKEGVMIRKGMGSWSKNVGLFGGSEVVVVRVRKL